MEKAAPDPLPCAAEKLARFAHDQPANALANYYLAVSVWKRAQRSENPQHLRKCESLLQNAITDDPTLDAAYVYLGMVYAARADFSHAIETYKKAVEINPQSSEAHYRLSQAYRRVAEQAKSDRELQLYKEADKNETAAVEQQRREIRQFLIILKDQPPTSAPQPEKQNEKPN
jgi:tetratricopeptide (TPR) repeat protein